MGTVAKSVAEKLPEWWKTIQEKYESFKGIIKWAGGGIMALLGAMLAKDVWNIGKNLLKFGSKAGSAGSRLGRGAKNAATKVGNVIKKGAKGVWNLGRKATSTIGKSIKTGGKANAFEGLKYMKNQFTGTRAAGGGIFKSIGAMFKTRKDSLGRFIGRTGKGAQHTLVKTSGALGAKLIKGANIAGWLGLAGNLGTDYATRKGLVKEGSATHTGLKVGSTALEYGALGATIGSVIPGLGTAVGAGAGALIGAVKGWYDSQAKDYKGFGDFAKSKFATMKESVGKTLSSWGDGIKNVAETAWKKVKGWFGFNDKDEGAKPKKYAIGGVAYGGEPGRDSVPALLTPGERVLTNDQYQTLVKPKPTGGKEYIYNPGNTSVSNVNGNKITVKDFNVNISGTIKIDAGKNFANIDASTLLRDQAFVNQLKNVIKDSINNDMNGGRFMNDPATRRGQVSSTSVVGKL